MLTILSKNPFESGHTKLEVIMSTPWQELGERLTEKKQKQSEEINRLAIGHAVAFFGKVSLAVSNWLLLGFNFLTFRHLQAWVRVCFSRQPRH